MGGVAGEGEGASSFISTCIRGQKFGGRWERQCHRRCGDVEESADPGQLLSVVSTRGHRLKETETHCELRRHSSGL